VISGQIFYSSLYSESLFLTSVSSDRVCTLGVQVKSVWVKTRRVFRHEERHWEKNISSDSRGLGVSATHRAEVSISHSSWGLREGHSGLHSASRIPLFGNGVTRMTKCLIETRRQLGFLPLAEPARLYCTTLFATRSAKGCILCLAVVKTSLYRERGKNEFIPPITRRPKITQALRPS